MGDIMDSYVINGGRVLSGSITAESAKNAVLPILAASILADGKTVINNCPNIGDVRSMIDILSCLNVKCEWEDNNLIVDTSCIKENNIEGCLFEKMRSSVFMMGALLSRFNRAGVFYPGGCNIGKRPIDIHISALREIGIDVLEEKGFVYCKKNFFVSGKVKLKYPSVGATENVILASVIGNSETIILNAAEEPEIEDLANFLNKMGAKITGAGTKIVKIVGVKKLFSIDYTPIFDRIETGTYLAAAAITGGEVEIRGVNAKNMFSLINKFCDNTCKINISNDIIYIKSGSVGKSFNLTTGPYPDFPTDMQPQMVALASVSMGTSVVKETVFENRFLYTEQLKKMGAKIAVKNNVAIISGTKKLTGTVLEACDLRGGAALILAGLSAEGISTINGAKHIDRGYFKLKEKLTALGADITLK